MSKFIISLIMVIVCYISCQKIKYDNLAIEKQQYISSHNFTDHIHIPHDRSQGYMDTIRFIDAALKHNAEKTIIQLTAKSKWFVAVIHRSRFKHNIKFKYVGTTMIDHLLNLATLQVCNRPECPHYIENFVMNEREVQMSHGAESKFFSVLRDLTPHDDDNEITFTQYISTGLVPSVAPCGTELKGYQQQSANYKTITGGFVIVPLDKKIREFPFHHEILICEIPIVLPNGLEQHINIIGDKVFVSVVNILSHGIPNSYADLQKLRVFTLTDICDTLSKYDSDTFKKHSIILDDYVLNYNDDVQMTEKIIRCLDRNYNAHAQFLTRALLDNPFSMSKKKLHYNAVILDRLHSRIITEFDPFYVTKVKMLDWIGNLIY